MEATDELRNFREQWELEVSVNQKIQRKREVSTKPNEVSIKQNEVSIKQDRVSMKQSEALKLYLQAQEMEQEGNLDQAINLYRQSFRKDPDVEKVVQLHCEALASQKIRGASGTSGASGAPRIHEEVPVVIEPILGFIEAATPSSSFSAASSSLSSSSTPASTHGSKVELPLDVEMGQAHYDISNPSVLQRVAWEAHEVEPEQPVPAGCLHMADFPNEIMLHIFKLLGGNGLSSLVPASQVCKKWYAYFNDQEVWLSLCAHNWPGEFRAKAPFYHFNWRRMYSERPRIRYDGVYIAKISYVRQGLTEGDSYQVHMVTYSRYLRFFKDATVHSLCTPEPPSRVISQNLLKLGNKGVMQGAFASLEHLNTAPRRPYLEISASVREGDASKRVYHLTLELYSTYQGGSNKIVWRSYASTDPDGKFPTHYPLDQMGSFFFSWVQ